MIVGARKPLYSAEHEIQTSTFDYFARGMAEQQLEPSPDLFQSLRAKVAGLSRYNPWLARALAAVARRHGFDLVTLGPRTLRTDVALVGLVALVQDWLDS